MNKEKRVNFTEQKKKINGKDMVVYHKNFNTFIKDDIVTIANYVISKYQLLTPSRIGEEFVDGRDTLLANLDADIYEAKLALKKVLASHERYMKSVRG